MHALAAEGRAVDGPVAVQQRVPAQQVGSGVTGARAGPEIRGACFDAATAPADSKMGALSSSVVVRHRIPLVESPKPPPGQA